MEFHEFSCISVHSPNTLSFILKSLLVCVLARAQNNERFFFLSKISTEERLCLVWLHFLCVLQKYLQQLWDTVLLVALILSTGVIVQARWQYQDHRLNDDLEVLDFTFVSCVM